MAYIIRQVKSSSIIKMNPDSVDKNDPKDVQLQDEDIMYDIDLYFVSVVNKQEHEEHLKLILELLKKEELYAKFSKCEFWIPNFTQKKVSLFGAIYKKQLFQLLEARILCSAPNIWLTEGKRSFLRHTANASKKGFGAVLMQRRKGEFLYASRQLDNHGGRTYDS
ncbi:hypothetical protein Tco_0866656 [Tanacetum coccineum]